MKKCEKVSEETVARGSLIGLQAGASGIIFLVIAISLKELLIATQNQSEY